MVNKTQVNKAVMSLVALVLFISGCTKTRDARLSDSDTLAIFAISDFGTVQDGAGFDVPSKPAVRSQSISSDKALFGKTRVGLDADESSVPERMRFMFNDLEVAGQENKSMKIAFGVDSKFVTAYKVTSDLGSLTSFEKQIAVSSLEVRTAIEMQKAKDNATVKALSTKVEAAAKARQEALAKRSPITLLVPLFKFAVQSKGILERTKNELREETSNLTLRETEFSKATHIRLALTSDAREEIGGAKQADQLDQLYRSEALDGQVMTASELQERLSINMKFIPDQSKVFTKLDAKDMKVFEVIDVKSLTEDEARRYATGNANGEIIPCKDVAEVGNKEASCVLRFAATVPVKYKNIRMSVADGKYNTSSALVFDEVSKAQSQGLVEVTKNSSATRSRPGGLFDPLNTIKVSDLQGSFYFRRTFESASNMISFGYVGFSGDMSVVAFELEKDRLVVRNQKALVTYQGQGTKDREELMSLPVKYFKLEDTDADGSKLQVARLIEAKKEDAQYLEVDLAKSTIPISNSPLAFFDSGSCIKAAGSQNVANMDMRLAKDGMLNFSIEGAYTVLYGCHSASTTGEQFNYNISERVSFRRVADRNEFVQFAPNWSPSFQNSLNFNIFTMTDTNTGNDVRQGREGSQSYKPTIHDFRNGKVLTYWVGGLTKEMSEDRRKLIIEVSQEVVAEWNATFRMAFRGTENERSGDYIVLKIEDESNQGRLGDLDRNYLWFMDMPTANGLLGVAQSAPNPYSGTNVANNVIIYSGNIEKQVVGTIEMHKEGRRYEALLETAKVNAVKKLQEQMAAEKAEAAKSAAAGKATGDQDAAQKLLSTGKQYSAALQRLLQSAAPERKQLNSLNAMAKSKSIRALRPQIENLRNEVSDVQFDSKKSFASRVLKQSFQSEFRDDPVMMEAIIARELLNSEQGLSNEVRELLAQKANINEMRAKFESAASKRGTCFLRSRGEYHDSFLQLDFRTAFKKELLLTLSHEVGHAIGLNHNFKATYDKANFNFAGENTDRNYSSVMDYQGSSEMNYQGPGPYDLHALRAIYTGRIELSEAAAKKVSGGALVNGNDKLEVRDNLVSIAQLPKFMKFRYTSEMVKKNVREKGLIKQYAQCWDYQVGDVPACTRYDNGASATEIVKNEIQDYHRAYNRAYVASDRLKFNWNNKVAAINQSLRTFNAIRGVLDDLFKMAIYDTATSNEEMADYINAAQLGYDFFHELIRTPNTDSPHGETNEEIEARLFPIPVKYQTQVMGSDGKPTTEDKIEIRVIEARPLYDQFDSPDRFDTLGISYDKTFALQFLLEANPVRNMQDSTGWISYNEFEQYFKGISSATESPNMITLLEVLSGQLQAGIMTPNHEIASLGVAAPISRTMLDTASVAVIASTNQYKAMGMDSFAEFFKVTTLKGGKTLTDRPTAVRFGQKSTSQASIKFAAMDNSVGANALIAVAARRGLVLENRSLLGQKIQNLLVEDIKLQQKVAALLKTEAYKGKTAQDVMKSDADVIANMAANQKIVDDLTATLNTLNAGHVLATPEEIKDNPNMAMDKQVLLLRSMLATTNSALTQLQIGLKTVDVEQLQPLLRQLSQIKQQNAQLASAMPVLGLGQELLVELVGNSMTPLKAGGQISLSRLAGMIVVPKAVSTPHANAMYVIEDLARYTKIFHSEYEQ
ncbi:hypothetical protein AZI86_02825 [Bdellovibrio bacteriovorus]|uniref:EcxA zinc-binding domain-containing protein n=1 Tax=Bdellovibrio bacteriovorus TaxID=959 RepID=A0A150WNZ8_BDEBC|nr:zinc-dependent metalloprotease [Bdellovibrio bacteriovorus]KYG66019.1 hypothetical protein AZI86_02825 [Bdellovibrio bacteriovorus]